MNLARWEEFAKRHRGAIFGAVGGIEGTVQAWYSRGTLSADLTNYLGLARRLVDNGWKSSANGFWSPLYSWLLAVPMSLRLVSRTTELLWVHGINLIIFFGAMLCFHVFLRHTLRLAGLRVGPNYRSWAGIETLWYFTACAVFLFAVFEWLPNSLCTPDLLVASFIFLSAGFLAGILCRDRSWTNFTILGLALAWGYLAKTPAFPLAVLFFAMLLLLSRGETWRWAKCLACVAGFAMIAGPFVYTISKKEGRLTFGESGRVAYLMFGDGLPAYWLGEGLPGTSVNYDTVCTEPPVYAFREPQKGLFFPAVEPSHWYHGLAPHMNVRQEASNLAAGFHRLGEMAEAENDLIVGFVILVLIAGVKKGLRAALGWWFLWIPATFGVVMFWLVHVEERFIAPFIVLGCVGLYMGPLVAGSQKPRLVAKILLALLLVQGSRGAVLVIKRFFGSGGSATSEAAQTVADLEAAGVPQGSKIAIVGNPGDFYWAWMGQYSVVGELPPTGAPRVLGALESDRIRAYGCLAKAGARAALIHEETPELLGPGWRKVGPEDLFVRLLNQDSSEPIRQQ